jgi:hypothetical protein
MLGWNGAIAAPGLNYSVNGRKSSALRPSFRDGAKDQARNLEIPASMLTHRPEMTQ